MKPGVMAVPLAACLLAAGCSRGDEPEDPLACLGGAEPVSGEVLVETLARYGFELFREDACAPDEEDVAAMYVNIPERLWDTPKADVIWASDSDVTCDLYRRSWFGEKVRRGRTDTDDVLVRVLNVDCRIYESNAWHVERLALALKQLPKVAD